jgi:hypothetical protein
MSFPFDPPQVPPEDQAQQIADRDRLVSVAIFAADNTVMYSNPATRAAATRTAVAAAIGYLLRHGLITMLPADEWPEYLNLAIPEHLIPR